MIATLEFSFVHTQRQMQWKMTERINENEKYANQNEMWIRCWIVKMLVVGNKIKRQSIKICSRARAWLRTQWRAKKSPTIGWPRTTFRSIFNRRKRRTQSAQMHCAHACANTHKHNIFRQSVRAHAFDRWSHALYSTANRHLFSFFYFVSAHAQSSSLSATDDVARDEQTEIKMWI